MSNGNDGKNGDEGAELSATVGSGLFCVRDLTKRVADQACGTREDAEKWKRHMTEYHPDSRFYIEHVPTCEWEVDVGRNKGCYSRAEYRECSTGKQLCKEHANHLHRRFGAKMESLPNDKRR